MQVNIYSRNSKSGKALKEALANVQSRKTFNYGFGSVDNLTQLRQFESNGVPTIEFTSSPTIAKSWQRQGDVVWGRSNHHTQGKDIVPFNHPQWQFKDYWVKVIPNVKDEFRVHVFDGKVITQGKKVFRSDTVDANSAPMQRGVGNVVRNRSTGWRMTHNFRLPTDVGNAGVQAVKALGYLYGAVDIATDQNGKIYTYETNSGPAMDEVTHNAYVEAITKWATS